MATYLELRSLYGNSDLIEKTEVAVIVAADTILNEDVGTTNHANRLVWAAEAYDNPKGMARKMVMAILAANKGLSVAAVTGATDAALQTNVDAVVDLFATG